MKSFMNKVVQPVIVAATASSFGFLVIYILKMADVSVSRLTGALISFVVVAAFAFLVFPNKLEHPFTLLKTPRKLGLYFPEHAPRHILLGLVLAACTLGGILAASMLPGDFTPAPKNITLGQAVFAVNPALWEELFFRGVLMFVLLKATGSVKKAAFFQILLFGLAHIKGFAFWDMVDAFSVAVISIAFTYTAYKTRTLLAGIVFHYFRDALIFFVQPGDEAVLTTGENILFYALLWTMVGVACLLVKVGAERFGIQAAEPLYVEDMAVEQVAA